MRNPEQVLKAQLRQQVNALIAGISPERRRHYSKQACDLLRQQPAWAEARAVLLYASLGKELDVWELVEACLKTAKMVALPRFDAESNRYVAAQITHLAADLITGQFGIREPAQHCALVPLNQLDFVLVPGVAFDLHGRRLGRGKGYYDQILAVVRGKTCGVAFDEQIVPTVPVEPHDSELNCILTPSRWIEL